MHSLLTCVTLSAMSTIDWIITAAVVVAVVSAVTFTLALFWSLRPQPDEPRVIKDEYGAHFVVIGEGMRGLLLRRDAPKFLGSAPYRWDYLIEHFPEYAAEWKARKEAAGG